MEITLGELILFIEKLIFYILLTIGTGYVIRGLFLLERNKKLDGKAKISFFKGVKLLFVVLILYIIFYIIPHYFINIELL